MVRYGQEEVVDTRWCELTVSQQPWKRGIPWPRSTTYWFRNHSLSKKCDLARRPIWYVPFTHGVLQKDKYRHRVICPGIAASMGLRCSGRRNALGSVVGRRLCPYFSGTSAILAKLTKSNTNVQSPYRLPLLECTHDTACKSTKCLSPKVIFYWLSFI